MSTPAQIGKREYNDALRKAREANREIRKQVRRIVQASSSNLIQALTSSLLLALSENDEALERLDEIGETLKDR